MSGHEMQLKDVRRRDFLRSGALAGAGVALGGAFPAAARAETKATSCILLMLVGGPSQIDTWDMKPEAPAEIRGPFRPIRTNVRGVEISEIFPRMARHADKYAILRGVHHEAAPVHDTGFQLMQTGREFENGRKYPHIGCVLSSICRQTGAPIHVLLPGPIGNTGGNLSKAQSAGLLGSGHEPLVLRSELADDGTSALGRYGDTEFGRNCLRARQLVEAGVRFVTVNMFQTVFDEATWDIHGYEPFTRLAAYRDVIGPMFDMAYSALLSDLHERGLLASTMVVAVGEFGRTPRINPAGGRDHWPQCQSVLMAGGGIVGGQVIGSSDATGGSPKDRPVRPAEIVATMCERLGIDRDLEIARPGEEPLRLFEHRAEPIRELFV